MQGYNVFQPMGFDAFGLPAENFAIKTGIHPWDSTEKNIKTMEDQLKAMGAMFNWENEVITCTPEYSPCRCRRRSPRSWPDGWCRSVRNRRAGQQAKGQIRLALNAGDTQSEAYSLVVNKNGITISATSDRKSVV